MMYVNAFPVVIAMRNSNVYEERSLGQYAAESRDSDDEEEDEYAEKKASAGAAAAPPSPRIGIIRAPTRVIGNALRRAPTQAINTIGGAVKRGLTFHGVGVGIGGDSKKTKVQSRADFVATQVRGQLSHDLWWLAAAAFIITTIETSHFLGDPVAFSTFNIIFEIVSAYGCVGISVGVPWDAFSFSGGWRPASKLILCLVMLRGRHRGLPVALDRAVRLPSENMHAQEEEDHRRRLAKQAKV
jgi:Trk-type K+ transport system membrane component